jgi:cell filamentation protein
VTNWEDYFYPGTDVLRNKLGIQDEEELQTAERLLVEQRTRMGCPAGNFDLPHLQAIHHHLFQDVYEWAGELRQVDMFKNELGEYMPRDRIQMGMHDVHRRVVASNILGAADPWEFSAKAAEIIGDTNHAHPFREGNTRTQLQFLKQLGEQTGHDIDLSRIDEAAWSEAKILSGRGSYGYMNDQIRAAIVPALEKTPLAEKPALEAEAVQRQEAQGSVERPAPTREWEVAREAELNRQEIERRNQTAAQQEALADILEEDRRKGKTDPEIEERRRKVEEAHRELQERLAHQQRLRLERLELLYRRPPSERER